MTDNCNVILAEANGYAIRAMIQSLLNLPR